MQVREIMSSPPITVTPTTTVPEVARIMLENQISGVPVVDAQGKLLGLVTELDLIARNAPLRQPRYIALLSAYIPLNVEQAREYKEQLGQALATNASELMGMDNLTKCTVAPDADVEEALERMLNPELSFLPVVEHDRVVGVVTRTDLVRLIEQLETAPEDENEAKQ